MHSFFTKSIPAEGAELQLDAFEQAHLFKTLRAMPGEIVQLLSGDGVSAEAQIVPGKMLRVIRREAHEAPPLRFHIGCAAPRKQKLDLLLKQFAELGVMDIKLINCERSVAQPDNIERLTTLLKEACKQSGNPFLPAISLNNTLAGVLQNWRANNIASYYGAVAPPDTMPSVAGTGDIGFLIGPEGGFTAAEHALLDDSGIHGISLGPWILRLETAAVCGIAALRAVAR